MNIKQDLHVHTTLSKCAEPGAEPEAYLALAEKLGIRTLGFSDHVWDTAAGKAPCTFYKGQDMPHITAGTFPKSKKVRILRGCEAELNQKGKLGLSEDAAKSLDYVLCVHSHTQFEEIFDEELCSDVKRLAEVLCDRFSQLVEHPLSNYITAIAHPFYPSGNPENFDEILFRIPDDKFEDLFNDAVYKNIAIEINASSFSSYGMQSMHRSELFRVYEIAKECGCKFTFGTDCHDPAHYEELIRRLEILSDLLELTDADILTV